MRKSVILAGSIAAFMMGASTAALADDPIFNMVPADPQTDTGIDCTAGGAPMKSPGLTTIWIKAQPWSNGASHTIHDDSEAFGFENTGEFVKVIVGGTCDIGPYN